MTGNDMQFEQHAHDADRGQGGRQAVGGTDEHVAAEKQRKRRNADRAGNATTVARVVRIRK